MALPLSLQPLTFLSGVGLPNPWLGDGAQDPAQDETGDEPGLVGVLLERCRARPQTEAALVPLRQASPTTVIQKTLADVPRPYLNQ